MLFDVHFDIKGPSGELKLVPNKTNPVELKDLNQVLLSLVDKLPNNPQLGIEITGVHIEAHVDGSDG